MEMVGTARNSLTINTMFWTSYLRAVDCPSVPDGLQESIVNKKTLTEREVHTAVKLLLPPDLALHANYEAHRAVCVFTHLWHIVYY